MSGATIHEVQLSRARVTALGFVRIDFSIMYSLKVVDSWYAGTMSSYRSSHSQQ
jgi:hypothetical protein